MIFVRTFLLMSLSLSRCFSADCSSVLPKGVTLPIGWRVVSLVDLPKDDRELWEREHGGQCPGAVVGKLTGDGRVSYALALLQNGPGGKMLEQLVVMFSAGRQFSRITLVKPTAVISPFVVWVAPPGKYSGVDGTPPVRIPHDSFVYEKMEATARQFFYRNGGFRSLLTAE